MEESLRTKLYSRIPFGFSGFVRLDEIVDDDGLETMGFHSLEDIHGAGVSNSQASNHKMKISKDSFLIAKTVEAFISVHSGYWAHFLVPLSFSKLLEKMTLLTRQNQLVIFFTMRSRCLLLCHRTN